MAYYYYSSRVFVSEGEGWDGMGWDMMQGLGGMMGDWKNEGFWMTLREAGRVQTEQQRQAHAFT